MLRLNAISRSLLPFFIFFLTVASFVTGSILKKSKPKLKIAPYEIGSFELKLMRGDNDDLSILGGLELIS